MFVFRISKSRFAETLRASGRQNRWNTEGKFVLYSSSSLSLACLETIVHTSGDLLYTEDYKSIVIEIPGSISVGVIDLKMLPKNWKEKEQKKYIQQIGDDWYNKQESLLLQVPSAIINREFNYLINTKHPDFKKLSIAEIDNFMFDSRIKN